jgi:hypothetical protein
MASSLARLWSRGPLLLTLLALGAFVVTDVGCLVPIPIPIEMPSDGGDAGNGGDDGSGDDGSGDDGSGDDGSGDDGSGDDGSGDDGSGDDGSGDDGSGDDGGGDDGSGDDGSGDDGSGDDGSGDGDVPNTNPPTTLTLELIAETGDDVPSQDAGTTFVEFGIPIIDQDGRVAFWASYEGASAAGEFGLYVWEDQLRLVVHNDPDTIGIVPERDPPEFFGVWDTETDPLAQDIAWGGGDRLLFVSETDGGQQTKGIYRWRATDDNIVRVVDGPMMIDVLEGASLVVPDFYLPGVSDNGLAVFGADYLYFRNSSFVTGKGVFTSNGTAVTLIADDNNAAADGVPDQDSRVQYAGVDAFTTINASGDALFQSYYFSRPASFSRGSAGVYLTRSGSSYRVIDNRSGVTWPGLQAGAQINPEEAVYSAVAIGPNSDMAVDTTIDKGSGGKPVVLLWDWADSRWYELTGNNNTAATDLISGVNDDAQTLILAGELPYLATKDGRTRLDLERPTALVSADLTWLTGGAINNAGRAALRYRHDDSTPGILFWTGETMLLVADATQGTPEDDIVAIGMPAMPEEDRPGRSGALSDADELVFRIERADGTQAIYIARAE